MVARPAQQVARLPGVRAMQHGSGPMWDDAVISSQRRLEAELRRAPRRGYVDATSLRRLRL